MNLERTAPFILALSQRSGRIGWPRLEVGLGSGVQARNFDRGKLTPGNGAARRLHHGSDRVQTGFWRVRTGFERVWAGLTG